MEPALKPTLLLVTIALASALVLQTTNSQQITRANQQSSIRGNNNNNNNSPKQLINNRPTLAADRNNKRSASNNSTANNGNNNNNNIGNGRLEFVEDELPADFYEMPPEQLDLGMNATGRAPVPILNVAVLQNGQVIDNAINVHPGTPLEMVIYLDDKSAKVYGLLASYLKVQDDTFRQREEVIILNGCSIDTYIFGNFEHNPEDKSLRAKFKAFKFPDSNFVRFTGTVNVCIKQCARVNCSGGRRKRASGTNSGQSSSDRLVQVTVSTVLRISNPVSELQRVA